MSQLAVNTPKGQDSLKREERSVEILNNYHPGLFYAGTPKDSAAIIDAVLITPSGTQSLAVCGIAEQKSRWMSYQKLKDWDFEWLITNEKLQKSQKIAEDLCVPLFGLLYLIPDDCLLFEKFWEKGKWNVEYEVRHTETWETTENKNKIFRDNAFVKMGKAEVLKGT